MFGIYIAVYRIIKGDDYCIPKALTFALIMYINKKKIFLKSHSYKTLKCNSYYYYLLKIIFHKFEKFSKIDLFLNALYNII